MKKFILLSALAVTQILATPVSVNYTNLFYANGGSQLGEFGNFAVRNVTVTTDTATPTNNLRISLNYNFGANTLGAYAFAGTTLTASDLFFRNGSGTIQYGIPLVGRASGFSINGINTTGANSTTAGTLYNITNPAVNDGVFRSEELGYTAIFGQSNYGFGRAVLLDPRVNGTLAVTNAGSAPNVVFNGTCSTQNCTPEFTVSLAFSNINSSLLAQFANGSITPFFTGTTCGNDLLVSAVPEPGSVVLMSSALVLIGLRLRRKK